MNQDDSSRKRLPEARRQARVLTSGVFGMRGDAELCQIVELAAAATRFPYAAVSIVDRSRLWLAVAYGFDPREFTRPDSFCDAAIQVPGFAPLCVPDAWCEPRFKFAPAVIEMDVRAYYAAPLVTSDGFALGTLCVLDQKPRTIDVTALALLTRLATDATAVIDREQNAVAHAQYAIAELATRIRFAISDEDDEMVTLLDEELRQLEAKLKPEWESKAQ
ncbi:GAF domain-containing protein [Sphingomonas xinjiangensis]|uniref:GAF domain-containing protein n=1 Tax=Sphingomonas xinjiangensis TaxID=643568 RepID=A0A840YTQ1_9SPHN|nr:GAF domain-containing protein [Sphingomonas xinjiangensis]MBB5713007.1 GAF domain-containing protein [Sphingomonas xinjiangensis]